MDDEQTLSPYIVFEGGGAKGFAHVGALSCLEKNRHVQPAGVAGTSAGAITAALVASVAKPLVKL